MGRVVNQAELAEIFGVSKQSINAWQADGLPVAVKGKRGKPNSYDTAKAIEWYVARETGNSQESAKDRLSRVQAERIELELAQSRGELLPASEVAPTWASLVVAFRQALLGITASVFPLIMQLDEDAGRKLLDEAIADALSMLAGDGDAGEGDAGAAETASEDVAVGVGGEISDPTEGNGIAGKIPVREDALPA